MRCSRRSAKTMCPDFHPSVLWNLHRFPPRRSGLLGLHPETARDLLAPMKVAIPGRQSKADIPSQKKEISQHLMLQSPRGGTAAGYATLVSWDRTGHAHHCEVARSQTTTATQAPCVKLKRKHAFTQIYIYIYIYTHDSSPGHRPALCAPSRPFQTQDIPTLV